ncbi:hypothetical protein AK812_SmicGene4739 [Symbiodinium microadriaticum]|uniref:Uncharacterized protein n=1 Tax=Symbiodinium microadriaticum TaxID=2951 RepID=A0A1Q9EVL8_SYMMI|nr:hypothetical protein AK812_SmicGene4739 [Symbiodinium microadriaticum]
MVVRIANALAGAAPKSRCAVLFIVDAASRNMDDMIRGAGSERPKPWEPKPGFWGQARLPQAVGVKNGSIITMRIHHEGDLEVFIISFQEVGSSGDFWRQEQERGELLLRVVVAVTVLLAEEGEEERPNRTLIGRNLYFRNVAYFIDLMDENDTARRHRERRESKRRLRKEALKQQERLLQLSPHMGFLLERNVFRGDVRRQSQMRILVESRAGKEEERSSVDNEKRAHEFALIHAGHRVAKACKYEPPLTADGSSALKDQLWGLLELEGHSDYLLLNRLPDA